MSMPRGFVRYSQIRWAISVMDSSLLNKFWNKVAEPGQPLTAKPTFLDKFSIALYSLIYTSKVSRVKLLYSPFFVAFWKIMKRPTQVDVARLAGVSRATVSYVLNDPTDQRIPISSETRQRVLNAIAEL